MKIACLQFAPALGQLDENMEKAKKILENTPDLKAPTDSRPLWLILPELAFSGYNFPSLEAIKPFLEPTCAGPSTQWAIAIARQYGCHVTVGYPECAQVTTDAGTKRINYNSSVTIAPNGRILGAYRKRFLYYTDETWAAEGDSPTGFFAGELGALGKVSMGICMDINPYKFMSPWRDYEFATHVLDRCTPVAVVSMAFLTRLTLHELGELPLRPDEETFAYWIERFQPLVESVDTTTVVVFANRCGTEGSACYAGTSSVILVQNGKVSIYDVVGKMEEKCLVVDLTRAPKYALQRDRPSYA
ncbi:N-terminal asparagine amidohydrolase-like protein [Trichodelitschia bisporula]|uniref:N-terminal asparagine amidohydrolase-like protein n=1 Tax=Trichodelitschia bisporula TaxID=703511 RepID=A0A6G1I814_9PEZI|nr:N-terminal asparagine amidohydrolase-like protein [Trichodelitschia bisporula]